MSARLQSKAGFEADRLLHESPYSTASRPLVAEPLNAEDWGEILRAYRAFIVQCRMIVERARARARKEAHDADSGC